MVSAVVLAAGASARMGRPKQLLPWGGCPMVRHVAETLAGSTASEVIVVVGCRADEVTPAALGGSEGDSGRRAPIRVAVNSAWKMEWPLQWLAVSGQQGPMRKHS